MQLAQRDIHRAIQCRCRGLHPCGTQSPTAALLLLACGEAWVDVVGVDNDLRCSLDGVAGDGVDVLVIVVVVVFLLLVLLVLCIDLDARVVR